MIESVNQYCFKLIRSVTQWFHWGNINIGQSWILRIFFFSTKSLGKGTGLGLSICYGSIEEHKGKTSVSSNGIGKGTAFTNFLPV